MHLQRLRRAICALLIAAFMMVGIAPAALAYIPAKVKTTTLVYQSVSPSAARLQVPQNLPVAITAIKGGWAQVDYKGHVGYMPLSYLTPTAKVPGYATCSAAVYSASGAQMCTIPTGTGVYVLGTINGGYLVMNGYGTLGFMKSGTLSNTKPQPAQPQYSRMDRVMLVAKYLLGRPYELSSDPPNTFNCSSFVQFCMAAGGYSMRGTAYEQAADGRYQMITSLGSLQVGDVLCFDTTGDHRVDHTAIYIGGGKFVEASKNAGQVHVNTFTSWYMSHFMCARRPA